MCKIILRAITLAVLMLVVVSLPVFAYLYRAPYQVVESGHIGYDMLGNFSLVNNTWLGANGFMKATGLDTRIETSSGTAKPHMVVDDRVCAAIPVASDSMTNLYYSTGVTPDLTDFYIIPAYNGYITTADDA